MSAEKMIAAYRGRIAKIEVDALRETRGLSERIDAIQAELDRLGPEEVARRRRATCVGDAKLPPTDTIRFWSDDRQAEAERRVHIGGECRVFVPCQLCVHHEACAFERNHAYFDDKTFYTFGGGTGTQGCMCAPEPCVHDGTYSRLTGRFAGTRIADPGKGHASGDEEAGS